MNEPTNGKLSTPPTSSLPAPARRSQPPTKAPAQGPLPDKKYFKIGEVADLVGVEPHVLRYWETQFSQVRPHKARSGHRLYRRREVETLLVIRELLHVQRFTIAGARQALRTAGAVSTMAPALLERTLPPQPRDTLEDGLPTAEDDEAGLSVAADSALDADFEGDIDAETAGLDSLDPLDPLVGGAADEPLHDDDDGAVLADNPLAGLAPSRAVGLGSGVPAAVEVAPVDIYGLDAEALRAAIDVEAGGEGGVLVDVEALPADATARPAAVRAARPRAQSHQLGFGFPSSPHGLMLSALDDARAILALLQRDDVRDRQALRA